MDDVRLVFRFLVFVMVCAGVGASLVCIWLSRQLEIVVVPPGSQGPFCVIAFSILYFTYLPWLESIQGPDLPCYAPEIPALLRLMLVYLLLFLLIGGGFWVINFGLRMLWQWWVGLFANPRIIQGAQGMSPHVRFA